MAHCACFTLPLLHLGHAEGCVVVGCLKLLLTLMAAPCYYVRSDGHFADPRLSAQNEIKMVLEAEHIAEAVLNSFKDIITATQSVDDISVKVWGADACRGSVHGRVRLPYHPSRCGGFLLCGQG